MKSGWVTKKLGEVCEITMGASPDSKSYNTSREGLPFYQGKTEFGIEHPTPVKWCSAPVKIASMGDILLSVRAPIGPVNFANEKCCIGRGLSALRFEGEQRYLYYFLQANESELNARGTGTTFKCISGQSLRQIPITIPPLAEQKRIVAKIDAAFEKIDALKANAEKNLANAKELFQSALDEAMRPKKGWIEKRLGEVCDVQLGKMLDKAKNKGKPYPYLANLSVRWRGFDLSALRTMPFTDSEVEKFSLRPGDVLMCEGGEPGRCAIWQMPNSDIKFQKAVHRIRPGELVMSAYLVGHFEAIVGTSGFQSRLTGATIKHLPRERLVEIPIAIPPIAEQREIVKRLDCLSAFYQF